MPITNPQEIAVVGQKIYDELYREEYERKYPQQFVAIDVESKDATVDPLPEGAIEKAMKKHPDSYFHLIKVGAAGAFRMSYASSAQNWLF